MMDDNIVVISHAGSDRWKEIMEIVDELGWFYGDDDYQRFIKGFGEENFNILVAVDKKTDRILGSVVTGFFESIEGSPALVTLGLYIVRPELQGNGLGTMLFQQILNEPRFADLNFGLNGAPYMTKKYAQKFGYDKYPTWQGLKYKIDVKDIHTDALHLDPGVKVVNFKDANYEELIKYDTKIQGGIRRDKFLLAFLDCPTSFCKIALDSNGHIVGFGNVRTGCKKKHLGLGPLAADSGSIAETLIKEIIESIPNLATFDYFRSSPPNNNESAKEIFERLSNGNLDSSGVCYPQFTKEVIEADSARIFSITEYGLNVA